MATSDNQALLMEINADITKVVKKLNQVPDVLDGVNAKTLRKAKAGMTDLENAMASGGKRAGHALAKQLTGETGKAITLNRMQMMELAHVGRSVFDGLAAGQSPMRILTMESARLGQALGSGEGGVAGGLAALGGMAVEFAPIIAIVGVLAAAAGGVGLAFHAAAEEADALRAATVTLDMMGNGAKYSAEEVAKVADGIRATGVSAKDANAELRTFIQNNVAPDRLESFATAAREMAKVLGEDTTKAAQELSTAFTGTYKDMMSVKDVANALDDKDKAYIKTLYDSGRASEARSEAFRIYSEKVGKAYNDSLSETDRLQHAVAGSWSALTSAMGNTSAVQAATNVINGLLNSMTSWLRQYEAVKALSASDLKAEQDRLYAKLSGPDSDKTYRDEAARGVLRQQALRITTGINIAAPSVQELRQRDEARMMEIEKQLHPLATGDTTFDPHKDKAGHLSGAPVQSISASVTQALDAAEKAKAAALAAISDDILSKAKAEKDAVDAALKQTLDGLKAKKEQVDGDKKLSASKKQELDAQLDAAMATQAQAADIKKRTIDAEAQIKLDAEALARHKEIIGYQIQELKAREAMTSDAAERARIEHQILDLQKSLSDESIRNDQTAKQLRANAASPDGTPVVVASSGLAQKASDAAYASQSHQIDIDASPLARYAQSIGDINTAMENAEVSGIEGFNQGLLALVGNSKSAMSGLLNVFRQFFLDIASAELQSTEKTLFHALHIPGFASGTSFAPGGLSLVGERGPELVNLPRGSQVFNNAQTQAMLSGIGGGAMRTTYAPAFHFDLRGAVVTQDLLDQMNKIGTQAATAGAMGGSALAQQTLMSRARRKLG